MIDRNSISEKELQEKILDWANERGLIKSEFIPKQRLKLFEEVGETAGAILKDNKEGIVDGLGDIYVVLTILNAQMGIDFNNPLIYWDYHYSSIDFYLQEIISNTPNLSFQILGWLADKLDYSILECANIAYEEIKNRKGKLINGSFIKE